MEVRMGKGGEEYLYNEVRLPDRERRLTMLAFHAPREGISQVGVR